jgi:hypothetical protein
MAFKDNTLTFSDDKIVENSGIEVMMDWEAPIMGKSAEYICHNSGDVLEIGFGMGICADYIQAQGVNSHTIIEIHPQILERLHTWAEGKSNVTIIEGDWSSVSISDTYDGIFLDTFGDDNLDAFKDFVLAKAKSGARITYWNNFTDNRNAHNFDSVSFENISITPDENMYFTANTYNMPKVEV